MGKATALVLGLAALALMAVGLTIVVGLAVRVALAVWRRFLP